MNYHQISVERDKSVFCVRLRQRWLGEADIEALGEEVQDLLLARGCRKLAFSLRGLDGVYSMLLGKLLDIRRRLLDCGGKLMLYDATEDIVGVFEVCQLTRLFHFAPDQEAAVAALATNAPAHVA